MMLENNVCLLDLAKRLKEFGVKQKSYFCWFKLLDKDNYDLCERWQIDDQEKFEEFAAYTASELIAITPQWVNTGQNEPFNNYRFNLEIIKIYVNEEFKRVYSIKYYCDTYQFAPNSPHFGPKLLSDNIYDSNLANALAKNIIALYEKKYEILL